MKHVKKISMKSPFLAQDNDGCGCGSMKENLEKLASAGTGGQCSLKSLCDKTPQIIR